MKLPPAVYLAIAISSGLLLIIGLGAAIAGLRDSSSFFARAPVERIEQRLGRRGARAFCLALGGMLSLLGAGLLAVSVLGLFPPRVVRSIAPLPQPANRKNQSEAKGPKFANEPKAAGEKPGGKSSIPGNPANKQAPQSNNP